MKPALLAMDFEPAILAPLGGDDCPALANAVVAVEAARKAGIDVIFVRVGFRPGYPEVNPRNKFLVAASSRGDALHDDKPTTQVHASLNVGPEEPVVVKRRIGAFNSDLNLVLSGKGIDHLILAGVSTGGVVLSTVRDAADRDFGLTVLSDACFDRDPEVHTLLTTKTFPGQATVVTTAEWVASL